MHKEAQVRADAPCCQRWRKARDYVHTIVRILHLWGATTPRNVVLMYSIMEQRTPGIVGLGTAPHCPCNDTPHPEAFRELVRRVSLSDTQLQEGWSKTLMSWERAAQGVLRDFSIEENSTA